MKKLNEEVLREIVLNALREDVGTGDVTASYTIDMTARAEAVCIAKEDIILCGIDCARIAFRCFYPKMKFKSFFNDGARVSKGQIIFEVKGDARSIVSAERTALNFIGHLSGIATKAFSFQQKVNQYGVKILDTRKTIPNLRLLEKYAVFCGGAKNHRIGLYDMVLIKENHLYSAGIKTKNFIDEVKLKNLVEKIKQKEKIAIEIEAENLREAEVAMKTKCDVVLLDNFNVADIKKAVVLRNKIAPAIKLEVSGGVNEKNLIKFAKTKIDYISIGALTHSAKSADVSLLIKQKS